MRIKNKVEGINYSETQGFFDARAKKYNENNPYSVTMYQDNNPELVKERNNEETKRLKPLLKLNRDSRILDVACGIGRWSDAIDVEIDEYCGIDFCHEFIELAKERNKNSNRLFFASSSTELASCMEKEGKNDFNRILLIGSLMYLNDDDVMDTLTQIEKLCDEHAIICVREPIGIGERLTLKEQFSEELQDNYNAIYRTQIELEELFKRTIINKGFSITQRDYMYKQEELNNRKETTQFFWILER